MVELKTFFTYKVENDNFNTIIEFEKNRYSSIFFNLLQSKENDNFFYINVLAVL